MGVRNSKIFAGLDKNKTEIFVGDKVVGKHGGLLKVCISGSGLILLDSFMYPFPVEYLNDCLKYMKG